ncbi:hypothetical protein BerOc1_03086 [Pseudodesulfovibrio hydrargyri]|uniref:Uncharacterized protein n=1 Tax=Pseudodesulfovibrio hydrargyri TaxID=2125990 RepID=A0A1J5MX38_9BACT|nr:hypothetical protein [Pseudodesulfovibrio hydrargyri]OIQ51141.1 hypothetical protein BerOc1_03086 [Pseudodesulfovibrio hydrargyri]
MKNRAVAYLDIIGFGALTNKSVQVEEHPFLRGKCDNKNLMLSIELVKKYRKIVQEVSRKYRLGYSLLSDSAFLWTQKADDMLYALPDLMWRLLSVGILCRGGLSYGETVCENKKSQSSKFLVGDAVTRAVKLEASGKGARIFMDTDFPSEITGYCFGRKKVFCPLTLCTDFSVIDEFKWYRLAGRRGMDCSDGCGECARSLTAKLSLAVIRLRWSPLFAWNAVSKEGRVQLGATTHVLSETLDNFLQGESFSVSSDCFQAMSPDRRRGMVKRVYSIYKKHVPDFTAFVDFPDYTERSMMSLVEG